MSRCGVHDERIYALLVETLQRTPKLGANYLAEYGEVRALDVLAHTFDTLPLRDEAPPWPTTSLLSSARPLKIWGPVDRRPAPEVRGRRRGATPSGRPDALGRGPSRRACLAHAPTGDVSHGHTSSYPLGDTQTRTECPLLVWQWQEV
jgi:hypothetical protein